MDSDVLAIKLHNNNLWVLKIVLFYILFIFWLKYSGCIKVVLEVTKSDDTQTLWPTWNRTAEILGMKKLANSSYSLSLFRYIQLGDVVYEILNIVSRVFSSWLIEVKLTNKIVIYLKCATWWYDIHTHWERIPTI